MKKLLVVISLLMGAMIGAMFFTPTSKTAVAGVEPSPFQPQIFQLQIVALGLNVMNFRVGYIIDHPPDPCVPPDRCLELKRKVDVLGRMTKRLSAAEDFVGTVIEEVLENSSDDNISDILPALRSVRTASLKITESIILGTLPDQAPLPAELVRALSEVRNNAQFLALGSQGYIALIERYGEPVQACVDDRDCPQEYVCVIGICQQICYDNSACPEGQHCILGFCSPEDSPPPAPGACTIDSDCPESAYCLFSVCVPDNAPIPIACEYDTDCPSGLNCVFNMCLPY
jgi:hypothetical protein